MKLCTIDDCDRALYARWWCYLHWQRWRRTGDPLTVRKPTANSGWFKPGQVPPNKGVTGVHSSPNKGKHLSSETKAKISKSKQGQVPWNKGKPMSEETRSKVRAARAAQIMTDEHREAISKSLKGRPKSPEHVAKLSGENNYRWSGGRSSRITNKHWAAIREQVLERDGYTCVACGSEKRSSLVVHHRIERGRGGSDEMINLVTACRSCHNRHHCLIRSVGHGLSRLDPLPEQYSQFDQHQL